MHSLLDQNVCLLAGSILAVLLLVDYFYISNSARELWGTYPYKIPVIFILHFAVVSTLLNFVKMFARAHEENCKQLELEKKKARKEVEQEKVKNSHTKKEPQSIPP